MELHRYGIREAKANLSKLLKLVQHGKIIVLTDRGRPVGQIVPIEREKTTQEKIDRLELLGIIETRLSRKHTSLPEPIKLPDALAQRILQKDRENVS